MPETLAIGNIIRDLLPHHGIEATESNQKEILSDMYTAFLCSLSKASRQNLMTEDQVKTVSKILAHLNPSVYDKVLCERFSGWAPIYWHDPSNTNMAQWVRIIERCLCTDAEVSSLAKALTHEESLGESVRSVVEQSLQDGVIARILDLWKKGASLTDDQHDVVELEF